MSLITRFYGPNAKGSKLTVKDMDENLYYLQSFGVDSVNYNNNVLTFTNPTGGTYSVNINSFSGLTINGSLSATTYYGDGSNLTGITTENTFTTGGTYISSASTINFTNNDGGTFSVTGITSGGGVILWNSGSTGNFSVRQITDTTTDATANYAVAEGRNSVASGLASHAEGNLTVASGNYSHAEGSNTVASGNTSHAEGSNTNAGGNYSHAEGFIAVASGDYSHAEGSYTVASGNNSHAEGSYTVASGNYSHAEGYQTTASGLNSHAGGFNSESLGVRSFIHSSNSIVTGDRSVVLGGQNITGATNDTVYVPNLNIVNIISANDDTDAGLSGLTTGDVYQTSGAGASPLNVPGILMIKQ